MPEAKVQLDIEGMTCAACQIFVEKTLNEQAGVTRASVNLMMNQAVVEFDPALVSAEQLAAAVEDTGYGAKLPVAGRRASWRKNWGLNATLPMCCPNRRPHWLNNYSQKAAQSALWVTASTMR